MSVNIKENGQLVKTAGLNSQTVIIDNLTTQDATKALSANQGYVLNQKKIDKTASEIQTSDGQFTTVTGGLMQKCIVDLEPIQSGSGTPSPSNVRAITGHTQVQVANSGKQNMIDPNNMGHYGRDNTTGQIDRTENTLSSNTNLIKVKPSTTYTISRNGTAYGGRIFYYNSNKEYINNTVDYNKMVFTTPNNCYYVAFQSGYANGALDLWCMTEGSEVVPYKPFDGYSVIINLGTTRYGGTFDAVSGVLTVTHVLYSDTWGNGTGATDLGSVTRKIFDFTSVGLSKNEATTSRMNCAEYLNSWAENSTHYTINSSSHKDLYLFLPNGTSSDFAFQLAYELATPFTIQRTPTQLKTLVGQNDVFAPLVGQTVEKVEFREVLAIDDVPKAIPYENVAPDMGTGEDRTYFRIKKYGRLVQLEFIQSNYWAVVEQQTKVVFGVLPDGYYDKQPSSMLHPDVEYEYPFVNETATNQYDNRKLFINMVNGEVYSVYQANDVIHPMGSITYILDND